MNLKRLIQKWVHIDKPEYATLDEWDEWENQAKKSHPIKYFLSETIPHKFTVHVSMPLYDKWWEFQHRFIPSKKYHIIDLGLPPGYYDVREQMLYAVMSLLVKFVEQEASTIEWSATPEYQKAYDTMMEVYHWWVNEYPQRENIYPDMTPLPEYPPHNDDWPPMAVGMDRYKNDPVMIKYKQIMKARWEAERMWDEKIQEQLHKVIDIREYLWS